MDNVSLDGVSDSRVSFGKFFDSCKRSRLTHMILYPRMPPLISTIAHGLNYWIAHPQDLTVIIPNPDSVIF